MKKRNCLSKATLFVLALLSLAGCKKDSITLSMQSLWFSSEASVQEIKLTANCDWSVSIDDGADWYTVDPMAGKNDAILRVTTQSIDEDDNRTSTFTITSAKGHAQVQVRVSQNTDEIPELTSLARMVFGVENASHWNTDYFGEVVEDSYKHYEFNPDDTATGHTFYFIDETQGVQQSHIQGESGTFFFRFVYDYRPDERIFHIEFETVDSTVMEVYDAPVLNATEEVFRIFHEYQPNFWELFDMKKIDTVSQDDFLLRRATTKRKGGGGILVF